MNSKVYIFANKHDENLLALYQECLSLNIECVPLYFNRFNINNVKKIITNNDYIIILHFPLGSERLKSFISQFSYKKCLNSKAFEQESIGNKLYQQSQIKKTNPEFTILTYRKTEFYNDISLPIIAKPCDASCGIGVKLITDYNQITLLDNRYIIQPYIPNDGDWRVVVVGGKAVSAIKRLGKIGQATNNIATGSFAIAETNTATLDRIFPIAEISAKSMGFDYVGVYIIKNLDTNQYYFLETNERPTFETSQILTGINIAKNIIENLIK